MYGIVNRAIEDLVVHRWGREKWDGIKDRSGINVDFFISNEPYDDDITYRLAGAVAEEMNLSLSEVLQSFGTWWILKTGQEKYGALMKAGGNSFREFLINLPHFHNRIYLIYPKLTPPEFRVSQVEENALQLHYLSKRIGLQDFVKGLIEGLAQIFETNAVIKLAADKNAGAEHDIFHISWS